MCPKCKSRERYRKKDRASNWLSYVEEKGVYVLSLDTTHGLTIHILSAEEVESWICSNCGYEIGRWG